MKIFVSYSSNNRVQVKALISDITSLGQSVWFDQELSGGQVWWDKILSEIRACELFIFAVTSDSIKSLPCKLEYTYAYECNRPILPVLLTNDVNTSLLPIILQERQFVNYVNQDKAALLALNSAFKSSPSAPVLPKPLPTPPEVPVSPLATLQAQVEKPILNYDEQIHLFYQIKSFVDNPDLSLDALVLLRKLEKHPTLLASVFKDINAFLTTVSLEGSGPSPSGKTREKAIGSDTKQGNILKDSALIKIYRHPAFQASLGDFPIYIDDKKVSSIRNNQEIMIEVTPSIHTIYINVWGGPKSNSVTFEAVAGDLVKFSCKFEWTKLVLKKED